MKESGKNFLFAGDILLEWQPQVGLLNKKTDLKHLHSLRKLS